MEKSSISYHYYRGSRTNYDLVLKSCTWNRHFCKWENSMKESWFNKIMQKKQQQEIYLSFHEKHTLCFQFGLQLYEFSLKTCMSSEFIHHWNFRHFWTGLKYFLPNISKMITFLEKKGEYLKKRSNNKNKLLVRIFDL